MRLPYNLGTIRMIKKVFKVQAVCECGQTYTAMRRGKIGIKPSHCPKCCKRRQWFRRPINPEKM